MKRWMARGGIILLLVCLTFGASAPARADGPDLDGVAFEQKLEAQLPLALEFQNERNQRVRLGDYFGARPILLSLNYLRCQNLCPLELQDLAQTLSQLNLRLGDQYDVLTVSIDSRDTPIIAADKRRQVLNTLGDSATDAGWHFLTGDATSIQALAQAVGFSYRYDAAADDYAHPLGVVVLTPQGRVARYLYGIDFPARDLRLALVEASQNKIGSVVDQVLLFCYHYDPLQGRYTAAAYNAVRLGALTGLLALGGLLFGLWRVEWRRRAVADPSRDR